MMLIQHCIIEDILTINRFIADYAGDIDGESYDCSTESSRAYVELLSEGEYCK